MMKTNYQIVDIRNLLFVFDIENTDDEFREKYIVSKNVNDEKELAELFDVLLRPEFLLIQYGRESLINTVAHFLDINDSFDRVFDKMTTYFDDEVVDQREFMKILLVCLRRYQQDGLE